MQDRYPDLSKPFYKPPKESKLIEVSKETPKSSDSSSKYPDLSESRTVPTLFGQMTRPEYSTSKRPFMDPSTPEETRQRAMKLLPGIPQGYVNSLIGLSNIIPGVNIPKLDIVPKNELSEMGQMIGDIASFGGPRLAARGLAAAMPRVTRLAENALRDRPFVRGALQNLGYGTEGALFGASHAPEGDKLQQAAIGGGTGSAFDIASRMISSRYPIFSTLGRIGLGYGIGQMAGHPGYGALAGALPQMRYLFRNPSELRLAENALRDIEPHEVTQSLQANRELGTQPTPGQAIGSYVVQGREGALRGNAGRVGENLEQHSLDLQRNAANRMLDQIYEPTPAKDQAINSAYRRANAVSLPINEVRNMVNDPIVRKAFEDTRNMPGFENVPVNNYRFLSQVKRKLWEDYLRLSRSASGADQVSSDAVNNARIRFDTTLKNRNPDYAEATRLAAPRYRREEVENKLNLHDENLTGKNVYTRLLQTPKKYEEAQRLLRRYPEALESLNNMRAGWREYANIKSGSQAEAQAKTRIDQARNIINKVNDMLEANIGRRATEAQIRYIHSDLWPRGFELIQNARNQREAIRHTLDMIGKMGLAYGLTDKETENFKSLITKKD